MVMKAAATPANQARIFALPFGQLHPLYVKKAERKGRTKAEVDEILCWLTGHTPASLEKTYDQPLETFLAKAPKYNPKAELITGLICGVRVETIEEPTMKRIRQMDKLIDELANGKAMERILRK